MWLKNPTRILIMPHSQNKYCSWTSRLSPAHRAHHMQTVTYYNSSKTQHPRTTFWKTAWEARTTHQSPETPELEPRSPDTLSLSPASPLLSFSQKMEELMYCANPLTHSPGQNMSDHRTSYQLPSHYVVEESHKDTDNATQPKQALLMDIPAEPCPQSSSHADCVVLQQLQDSAPKDDFLENSLGSQDNTSQSPETPELEPRSPDTVSLSPASPLLSFLQKIEELVYTGTKLSASPQISTKKRRAPQPPKTAGSALPPPPVRALRPLPQRQGPNPPPSAVGEPKTTDNSSQ